MAASSSPAIFCTSSIGSPTLHFERPSFIIENRFNLSSYLSQRLQIRTTVHNVTTAAYNTFKAGFSGVYIPREKVLFGTNLTGETATGTVVILLINSHRMDARAPKPSQIRTPLYRNVETTGFYAQFQTGCLYGPGEKVLCNFDKIDTGDGRAVAVVLKHSPDERPSAKTLSNTNSNVHTG